MALEASSTSGQLVTFGLAEGDEELAMLHWSDGIGTLECLGEGTVTLTACQYSSDRNYKNAEPVVKILIIARRVIPLFPYMFTRTWQGMF